jgi:hypothetical protein
LGLLATIICQIQDILRQYNHGLHVGTPRPKCAQLQQQTEQTGHFKICKQLKKRQSILWGKRLFVAKNKGSDVYLILPKQSGFGKQQERLIPFSIRLQSIATRIV